MGTLKHAVAGGRLQDLIMSGVERVVSIVTERALLLRLAVMRYGCIEAIEQPYPAIAVLHYYLNIARHVY